MSNPKGYGNTIERHYDVRIWHDDERVSYLFDVIAWDAKHASDLARHAFEQDHGYLPLKVRVMSTTPRGWVK